ncbi:MULTISPECIES: SCO family protein [unclassified Variovorax]|uniref:SCO family protein n=1 Tax=unclassified Variovorax TaxID=663243 RepID=UPI003ECF1D14
MSGFNSSPPTAARAVSAAADEPLGLTVHSMPSPRQALDGAEGRRTVIGRWKMILVMLCCAAPVIASYFTYYVIRPEGRRVYGELVDPQRSLPDLVATTRDGAPVRLSTLKGQWLLVAVGDAGCDALCEQQLYLQRQLRESLGREKDRLDRVWLVSDAAPVPERLNNGLHGATVLRVPAAQLAQWLAPASGHALAEHLYVVDPIGNWMMRFPARMDAAGASRAKRDLDRLLRASASWDEPGR